MSGGKGHNGHYEAQQTRGPVVGFNIVLFVYPLCSSCILCVLRDPKKNAKNNQI